MGIQIADHIEVALRMKGCIAVIAPGNQKFIIGDNTLVNFSSQEGFYMRGGLPNQNTYLWFPLNPKLGLLFVDGSANILGEVYVATQFIVGSSRGLVRGKLHLPNVGNERSRVTALDWAPLIINENRAVATISEAAVDHLRRQV